MTDHKHGEMDIRDHERTFEGFLRFAMYVVLVAVAILIFLAVYNS